MEPRFQQFIRERQYLTNGIVRSKVVVNNWIHFAIPTTTVLGAPAAIFDFASFSFHVPICTSLAKHTAPARKHSARVNTPILTFILPPLRTTCGRFTAQILVLYSASCNSLPEISPPQLHTPCPRQQGILVEYPNIFFQFRLGTLVVCSFRRWGTTSGKFLTSLEMSAFGQSSTGAKGTLVLTRALEDEIQARSG